MSYRPVISNMKEASSNEQSGLYEFILDLADGTVCRVFYSRYPEWKMTNISRLQKTPCPVCRKDFICKCIESYKGELTQQIEENQWIDKALAAAK
ncbi:hypothetical protein GRF59_12300 [Paenibacillus sp. HJL G12]|uniref:Uncharacterized protein n=1 Tax=Paenibacillus dendrobii TaxID=2691084 RepID=A0A7X3II89_9BACL|nr:hypothetical protein [Paenibacillus dendrobii]MWV44412.1 hypothetical protein [Paenibacillus dendrobii]